jgi:tetratricopeptide (TPR) repeat protein
MKSIVFFALLVEIFRDLKNVFTRVSKEDTNKLKKVYDLLGNAQFEQAYTEGRSIFLHSADKRVKARAGDYMLWALIKMEQFDKALEEVKSIPQDLTIHPYSIGLIHYYNGNFQKAKMAFEKALNMNTSENTAKFLMLTLLKLKELDNAYKMLFGPGNQNFDDAIHAKVEEALFYAQKYENSFIISKLRCERFQAVNGAFNAACAQVKLNNHKEAIKWIKKAIELGYKNKEFFENDPDLQPLQGHPEFREIMNKLS